MYDWHTWIHHHWHDLCAGKKLCVPQHSLPHPARSAEGFRRVPGWPKEQTCDWGLPYSDGSRVHVQCYSTSSGSPMYCVHRDRWDPERDLVSALLHGALETPLGPALGLAAVLSLGMFASTAR